VVSRLRFRREDGAVATEAVLVIPILVILAFGIIELALLLRDYVAVTSLARSGARVASAEPRFGTTTSPWGHDGVGTRSSFAQDAADALERASNTIDPGLIDDVWVYRATAAGFPFGTTSFASCPPQWCVRYTWEPPTLATPGRFTWRSGTWDPRTINACLGDVANGQSVGVFVRARHDWLLGVFPGGSTRVGESTVMRFEPLTVDHENKTGWVAPTATTPGTFAGCKP
jgi:hypothetical protein